MAGEGNKKIKVLQVLGGLYCGGTEAFVVNMNRSINKTQFQFDYLIHEKTKGHYDDEVTSIGATIYRIPERSEVGIVKYVYFLTRALLRIKPDIVHSHAMFNSGIVMLASFVAGVKKRVSHSHNTADQFSDSAARRVFRFLMRICILLFSTDLLACSQDAAKYLYGTGVLKKKKAFVISNGVQVDRFHYNETVRKKIRKELETGDQIVLGHVGRFTEQKNHDFLIDIYKSVHDRNPDSVLVLVGNGALRPQIEKKVERLGLTANVRFLGERNDIPDLLQTIDLFLLPSRFEGLPVVLIEAQAAGVNCIVSDTITRDCDITGRVTFLPLYGSPDEWADEILAASYAREDTSEAIKRNGYDSQSNAEWLGNFYRDEVTYSNVKRGRSVGKNE